MANQGDLVARRRWPRLRSWAIHDRWASDEQYPCPQSLCKAHLLRDLTFLAEEAEQVWATEMKELLTDLHAAVRDWQQQGVRRMPRASARCASCSLAYSTA